MSPDESPDSEEESRIESPGQLPELPIYDPRDELDEFEEEDDEEEAFEDGPRTILITGASGNIGRKLREAWSDVYDLVLIDRAPEAGDDEVIAAELSELDDDWITHFHGVDTVIHLAANPDEFSSWEDLVRPNLDALANVLH